MGEPLSGGRREAALWAGHTAFITPVGDSAELNSVTDDLSRARDAFAAWRSEHGRGRLPESLWALALDLLDRHSVAEVARELGLNQARIRAKHSEARRRSSSSPKTKTPEFVQLNPALLAPRATDAHPNPVRVDIERPDGLRLTVTIASDRTDALGAICAAFLRGAP